MITELERINLGGGRLVIKYVGTNNDTKPVAADIEPYAVDLNGSSFFEMDTGDTYYYDADSSDWVKPGGNAKSVRSAEPEAEEEPDFDSMTKAQLIEYAGENDIEIDKNGKKAEILEQIKE